MRPSPTQLLNLGFVAAWLGVAYVSVGAAMCVVAVAFFVHGVVGAVRRKITTKGRSSAPKEYVGAAAVREGLFVAFLGLLFGAFGLLTWLLPR
ncbi:hypothetical protein GCM10027430_35400 [Lysobacter tyrosinilyticus]